MADKSPEQIQVERDGARLRAAFEQRTHWLCVLDQDELSAAFVQSLLYLLEAQGLFESPDDVLKLIVNWYIRKRAQIHYFLVLGLPKARVSSRQLAVACRMAAAPLGGTLEIPQAALDSGEQDLLVLAADPDTALCCLESLRHPDTVVHVEPPQN